MLETFIRITTKYTIPIHLRVFLMKVFYHKVLLEESCIVFLQKQNTINYFFNIISDFLKF